MKRSATVLIIPVLSLLLAGAFAPQPSATAAPTPSSPRTATGWVFYLVNTVTANPWAQMPAPRPGDRVKPAAPSPTFESILTD